MKYITNQSIRAIREFEAYISYYTRVRPRNQTCTVIFARGRTGSTLLEDLLCSSGHFLKNGELLSKSNGPFQRQLISPIRYIVGLSKRRPGNFIFHIKPYHLYRDQEIDPATFLNVLYDKGWKILSLRRRNPVDHILSGLLAEAREHYVKTDEKNEDSLVYVECSRLLDQVEKRLKEDTLQRDALVDVDYLELFYEDDLVTHDMHQATADKVFDYLELERRDIKTKYKKINVRPLKETIINYDEFVECIHNNGLERFLGHKY